MTRRNFLTTGSLLMAGCAVGGAAPAARPLFGRDGAELGLQIYPLLESFQRDAAGTLRQIAGAGFRRVEMLTFFGRTGAQLKALLDEAGLICRSIQVIATTTPGSDEPILDGNLERLVENAAALGVRYVSLAAPPLPARAGSPAPGEDYSAFFRRAVTGMQAADFRELAGRLDNWGRAIARGGMTLAYHNHNFEFAPQGATSGFDIVMQNTDPKLVAFEMDIGWVSSAGIEPEALLRRYPGRFRIAHVKDHGAAPPNFTMQMQSVPVGSGVIDWNRVLPAARAAGVTDFFIEQEPPFSEPPIDAVRKSRAYLLKHCCGGPAR